MTVPLDTTLLINGYDPGNELVALSVSGLVELQLGVLAGTEALPIPVHVAVPYGALCTAAAHRPTNDLWIAATADAHNLKLLTADEPQSKLPIAAVGYTSNLTCSPTIRA